jgi:hypothetical protein
MADREQTKIDLDVIGQELLLDGDARADIELAAEAVLSELGLWDSRDFRRRQVVTRMATSWQAGRRLPLHLVSAGLDAGCY